MPYFKCTFLSDQGDFRHRTLFADNKRELQDSYLNADEKLVYIKRDFFHGVSLSKLFARRVGYREFLQFNQKLITLLRSGVSFIRGLEVIIENMERGTLKEILIKAETDIKNGMQISDAFTSRMIPFQRIYRASLMAGERSGNLDGILEKFNVYLEKISNLRRKTMSSLSYPIILFVFMIAMVMIILLYAIPVFSSFYDNFQAELPGMTKILISSATFLKNHIHYIVLGVILLFYLVRLLEKKVPNVVIIEYIKLKIPFIGKIIVENAMAIFTRTLSILISGGITIPESTTIAVETFANKYFNLRVRSVPEKIHEGKLLSDVLSEVKIFPGVMIEAIRVGESSGNLVEVLDKNADYFENAIDTKVNTLISLIEPILIIVMGFVVAFMLIAVYLPIFSTIRIVR